LASTGKPVDDWVLEKPLPPAGRNSLPFAPTQVHRASARIHFKSGAVQEVTVPPLPQSTYRAAASSRAVEEDKAWQNLWEEGDITNLELPVGGTVSFERDGEGFAVVDADGCAGKACAGMERVRLEQDVLFGLQQMRDSDASKSIIMRIPTRQLWPEDSVTLVTQFSVSRLARFERTLATWTGPISVTIYLTDATDIDQLLDYFSDGTKLAPFQKLALTIVKPDYSINEEALVNRLRYPINKLRNLALQLAPSSYVVVVDADFVPSPKMHTILHARGVPLIQYSTTRISSPTLRRTAVVVSAFALDPTFKGTYPETSSQLHSALFSKSPYASLTDANAGHGPSLPSLLFEAPPSLLQPPHEWPPKSWAYDVCYEPQWEPYYLMHRASHPLYDERFTDQGGDKQSHAMLLNALGYEFKVIRDAWFMHPPRAPPGEEDDVDKWPSERLVDPTETHHGDPAHFSSSQRDTKRFRYFQDFLPEMAETWGWNFRWPRGCGAGVVGVTSFGRARAGSVFGL
ncbi:beta-1,3-N-acetylglucosaminyltransferase, glycosyltransferase family 49 protein, partial [Pseudohyphozyma bogoriensis]